MMESGIFVRDFGTRLEEIDLPNSAVSKELELQMTQWKEKQQDVETQFKRLYRPMQSTKGKKVKGKKSKKGDHTNIDLSYYAGSLTREFLIKVCSLWKEIAYVMRDKEFKEDEEHLIDIFDVKCKEWGFLLLEMFGTSLGTGDYGHLTVEHVPMLFRMHRSLHHLSNQGYEAGHKLQRLLYLRATSHDSSSSTSSVDQILTHSYTEMLLDMRRAFREARQSITSGEKLFYYRGCGWKAKRMDWSEEDRKWIGKMDQLFTNLFGPDYCEYEYTEMTKHCVVVPGQFPLIDYNHEEWETNFEQSGSKSATESQHQSSNTPGVAPAPETTSSQQDDSSTARHMPKKAAGLTTQQHGSNTTPVAPVTTSEATKQQQSSSTTPLAPVTTAEATKQQQSSCSIPVAPVTTAEAATQQQSSNKCTATAMATATLQNSNSCHSDQVKPDDVAQSNEIFENLNVLTRGERASLKLPEVAFISKQDIQLVQSQNEVSNPLLVNLRPAESAVTHAVQLLKELSGTRTGGTINVDKPDDGDEDDNATVTMGRLGTFTKESIGLYQTMCSLASEAVSFREEERWLANSSSVSDLNTVRDVLCNSRPNEEIIRQGTCIMDATDFSTLACERYVNGFTIDTTCLKFLEDSKPTNLVYLSSYSQTWAKQGPRYFSQMVMPFFGHCAVQDATYILSPFHFDSPQHWGLLCFDVANRTVYFDDGLKIYQPRDILVVVKNMLTGFELLSHNVSFQEENWNQPKLDLPLPRFNMPHQTRTGEGSASCGVGVILSVRDMIKSRNCLPSFHWTFKNMASLRKELMALIIRWKK